LLDQGAASSSRRAPRGVRPHAPSADRDGEMPARPSSAGVAAHPAAPRVRSIAPTAEPNAASPLYLVPVDDSAPEVSELETRTIDGRAAVEPPGRLGLAAKRTIDFVGASAGLIVFGPFLVGMAAAILLLDGRPVLFRQERAGLGERPFRIFKFRTMRAGADAERAALRAHNEITGGASFKMTDDPRVTRLGRLLRRTSVDELPQLLNVLRGEMSIVGPRPHPFDDLTGYQAWHHGRFAMKPGITGLWQVNSRRNPDFDRWVELDLEYIRTWSPLLDIKIMARTIPAMVRSEGR
jgi:lipopolysaccharide/colanic/teichoic acid biosynthesis glycosyltransferase